MLALQLAARGYQVFAGCLSEDGIKALAHESEQSPRLEAFLLDVTKPADIKACADRIQAKCPNGLK